MAFSAMTRLAPLSQLTFQGLLRPRRNGCGLIVGSWTPGVGSHAFIWAAGIIASFDFPGANGTTAHGVNHRGKVVGAYTLGGSSHGYLLDEGTFTTIDVPGATQTVILGINDLDEVVGFFIDTTGALHGFKATP
jgi:uncharacterized membrane protein